jgi:hypothetical protein
LGSDYNINTEREFLNRFQNEIDSCEPVCPQECSSVQYRVIPTNSDPEDNNKIFIFSVTSFSSLELTQILKMSVYNLIASIGGSSSLFIGLRFISVIEIVELILDIFFAMFF